MSNRDNGAPLCQHSSTNAATKRWRAQIDVRNWICIALLSMMALSSPAHARSVNSSQITTRAVDLVIALDVSGSMSGLIDSAKQRLWAVVNELNRAQPQPDLRVAILSYGSPNYGKASGFVRVDQPFTRDLDAVNATLFSFRTGGGSEYVARTITTAVDKLQWSQQTNSVRIMFVAGNEAATQDPFISIEQAMAKANRNRVVVNTVYCGPDNDHGIPAGWQHVAQLGQGMYASIDQNIAAVAEVEAPQDNQLRALNDKLNRTYVPFGQRGKARQDAQHAEDDNAAKLSGSAAASRTVTKAGRLYRSATWDLVDAVKSGLSLGKVAREALPSEMRQMNEVEQTTYVARKSDERKAIQSEISKLAQDREKFLRAHRAAAPAPAAPGLDDALKAAVRSTIEKEGFQFSE